MSTENIAPVDGGDGAASPLIDATAPVQIETLAVRIQSLLEHIDEGERRHAAYIREAHAELRLSVQNLIDYLCTRQIDLCGLQEQLATLGLSSLGRMEGHTRASLRAVLDVLTHLAGGTPRSTDDEELDFATSRRLLEQHTEALLGPPPENRSVRIMVTLGLEAAENYDHVRELLMAGMDCARINCAHDDADVWERMIANVRRASQDVNRNCRILMDLAGPKIRTGPLKPGPRVLKVTPSRDVRGVVTAPARILMLPPGIAPVQGLQFDAVLPLSRTWIERARPGDRIRFRDARDKKRRLNVVKAWTSGLFATTEQTCYLESGITFELVPRGRRLQNGRKTRLKGDLPPVDEPIVLRQGDTFVLLREHVPGHPAVCDDSGRVLEPARISCTLPSIFSDLQIGEIVKLDDGRIEGTIRSITEDEVHVLVTQTREGGAKMRADKSINFPDSNIRLSGLMPKDYADLDLIARRADMVGLSFVNTPDDVQTLQNELLKRRATGVGIVLKIETKRGFQHLPALLFAAMRSYPIGVMIARGDLAVECGWERMAEVQEEMLWMAEAAHVPVIWATQVLEGLAQRGYPSRAEITDAAMSERAECVMLNKGEFIIKAIIMLDDVMRRMQGHQVKKTPLLRMLKISNIATTPS